MVTDFNALGYTVKLDTYDNETLSMQLREKGKHGGYDCKIFAEFLKPGDSFIDGGANIGYFSIIASKIIGNAGTVFAFEPEEDNFLMLEKNVRLNNCENVKLLKYGLWKTYEEKNLYLNPDNFGDHSVSPNTYKRCWYPNEKNIKKQLVPFARLDNLVSLPDFMSVKLIKLDIQGSEPAALKGMEFSLLHNKPAIILEFSPAHMYEANCSPFDIFAFIEENRYKMYRLDPNPEPIDVPNLFTFLKQNLTTYVGTDILLVQ